MKKWLTGKFLPMWAKETVLRDNRCLREELERCRRENARLRAFIDGMTHALRTGRRKEAGNK